MTSRRSLNLVAFVGSARNSVPGWSNTYPKRLATRVTRFVTKQVEARGHKLTILDPLELNLPVLERPHFFYKTGDAPQHLNELADKLAKADGFLFISGEYNHSIPPALSNMVNYFGGSKYSYRPSGIVTYSIGQFGGVRAAMHLRDMLGELGCLSVSNICSFPKAHEDLDEDGNPTAEDGGAWAVKRVDKMMVQLEWWAEACLLQKEAKGLPS